MPDFSNFECDACGACCRSLIVEAEWYDAAREPRIVDYGCRPLQELKDDGKVVMLYDTETRACPFLCRHNKCGIYATRPVCCVAVEAGDAKCQQARKSAGIPFLLDKNGEPCLVALRESCEDYGLELADVIEYPELVPTTRCEDTELE